MQTSLKKLLPIIAKPITRAMAFLQEWEADFETLRTKGYFKPGLEWKPIPNVVHNNRRPTTNEPSMTEEQIVRVPDVLHAGWTKKDRERAEVACMCVRDGADVRLACSKSRRKWHMDLQDMHSQR